jgi:hypothetical protein
LLTYSLLIQLIENILDPILVIVVCKRPFWTIIVIIVQLPVMTKNNLHSGFAVNEREFQIRVQLPVVAMEGLNRC